MNSSVPRVNSFAPTDGSASHANDGVTDILIAKTSATNAIVQRVKKALLRVRTENGVYQTFIDVTASSIAGT